ncbi:hypothetical protein C8R46DRAFT_343846 [Mycena filopes]|nr:hypothetical protein C8R46DRAFT_343846 [Mycena filopes]
MIRRLPLAHTTTRRLSLLFSAADADTVPVGLVRRWFVLPVGLSQRRCGLASRRWRQSYSGNGLAFRRKRLASIFRHSPSSRIFPHSGADGLILHTP